MKKFKNLCLLLALLIVVSVPVTVGAANTADTEYSFTVDPKVERFTAKRAKTNSTSLYVFYTSGVSWMKVSGYATVTNSDGSFTRVNKTLNKYGIINKGMKASLRTTIFESGYNNAQLGMIGINIDEALLTRGVWSPDSTQKYTVVN